MINFFRKIRKQLADDNKPLKYARYAIGEIVLVVIGILIALSINNWNEDKKKDELRRIYYVQILQELEKERIKMEESNKNADSVSVRLQTYKEFFKEPDLPIWEIILKIGNVFGTVGVGSDDWNFESNTNTITTLLSTGDIKLIPPILRNKILDLKHKQLGIIVYAKTRGEILLNSATSTATLYGGNDLGNRAGNQPKLLKYYSNENIQIQSLMGLETVLEGLMELWFNVRKRYTELILEIEEITKLINEEMKK